MTRWLDEHPDATYQQCADAVYLLARHGDSASEIYTRAAFARAAALADQTPDPQLAALIALAAVMRCPRYIRELDHHAVAADGSRLYGPWGGLFATRPNFDASSPPSTST